MVYCTNLQFAQRSGIGLRAVDELVGTGDNSNAYFDLDNDNTIAGSYALYYATAGSNNFTVLTETTHYTIPDLESGRIILTASGITALGTKNLYATYWYIDNFSNTVVTDLLAGADDDVDKLTGRKWDGPSLTTEYRNGRKSLAYPTTDAPYIADWDAPDFIVLEQSPITKIDQIYFLNTPLPISKFFNYDAGTAMYTDKTTSINSSTETPFNLFDASPATNDYVYIGSTYPFLGLRVNLSTVGTGTSTIDWEYYNGSAWADISESDVDSGASIFNASGSFVWTYPYGWAQNSVNGTTAYWIRGKLTDAYIIDPVVSTMTICDSVYQILEPRQYLFDSYGKLNFMGVDVPNGTNNLRIDYWYGQSSTPAYIVELALLIASLKAYVNLSGGSYDDATSYTLGSKSVTIGESYVNIREVLDQFRKRIKEILDMIGKRAGIASI